MRDHTKIHPISSLMLGSIQINVKNIDRMKRFYHGIMGLDVIHEEMNMITLGKDKTPLLTLHHAPHLEKFDPKHAGLYHFAILFASRNDLAHVVYRILNETPQFFSGSADHLVSEAFYFTDPENNGIELYFDRDKSTWQWENGSVKMASQYIDPAHYIQQHIFQDENEKEVRMGHIHLKVGNIEKAKQFYHEVLGFDVTAELPGALFVSVCGYHHHIGMNVWESEGAGGRSNTLGLKSYELILSEQKDFESLKKRLQKQAVSFTEEKNTITLNDPWNNLIAVVVRSS